MNKKVDEYIKTELSCPIKVSGVYTVHYFKYGRNFHFEGESHDFWEMVFIDSGTANVVAGNKIFNLSQGEAYFHKPNELHNISTNEEFANSAIITFECKSRAIKKLAGRIIKLNDFEKSLLNKIIFEAKICYNDKLNEIYLKKMTESENAPFGGSQIIKNCIELLLISMLRNIDGAFAFNDCSTATFDNDDILNSIYKILSDTLNRAGNVNLTEMSYNLGLSKTYLKTQFKKKTGFSIIQYFINMKIDKAKKLLSEQKFTISEIADALGFSSVHYFSRQFKLHTDMTPTEYVNSIQADNVL